MLGNTSIGVDRVNSSESGLGGIANSTPNQRQNSLLRPQHASSSDFKKRVENYIRSIQRYVWDDPDKPRSEKWFLFKLDVFLLSASCLGYFSKALDQANINNAYVSGMKEDLGMHGSELTYAYNLFTAGYAIGQIPAAVLVTRLRPSILIPTLEVLWSVLTICTYSVNTVSQLYAIRFLIGLFEAAYFPVMIYLIGSWYTKCERGKRVTLFYASFSLAGMFSGYLQAGVYEGLDGVLGHAGWQWLFIMCGVISLPIAFIGYFFIPDFPDTTRAFYLTESEVEWARERLKQEGLKPLGASPWNKRKIYRCLGHWQFWILPVGYFFIQATSVLYQPVFGLWLKAEGHTISQINVWPTGQVAVGVVVLVIAGMLSDSPLLNGRRWQVIIGMQLGTLFSAIILAIWDVPDGLKYTAYFLVSCGAGVPGVYFAWFPDLIPHDHELRGFVIACANTFSYVQTIWFSLVAWRTTQAPQFRTGFTAICAFSGAVIMLTLGIRFLEVRGAEARREDSHSTNRNDCDGNSHHTLSDDLEASEKPAA